MVYSAQLQAMHCYEPPGVEGHVARPQGADVVRRGVPVARAKANDALGNTPATWTLEGLAFWAMRRRPRTMSPSLLK